MRASVYLEIPTRLMCCGLRPVCRNSSIPTYFPGLCGANSTEIVQLPPFGASVPQVLAVTLKGGVAAGAELNEIGEGLSLTISIV